MSTLKRGWLLALLVIGVAGCAKKDDADATAGRPAAERPSQKRAQPKAGKPAAVPASAASTEAAPDPTKPGIRFDMTQDGKARTADEFDAWMKAQGVSVVKAGAAPTVAGTPVAKAAVNAETASPARK